MSEQKIYERRTLQLIRREVVERVRAYTPEGAAMAFEEGLLTRIVQDEKEGEDYVFPIREVK